MSNRLSFVAIHKSITNLSTVDLPSFVVLTGRNGSGKTHLLTAIKENKVSSSLVNDHRTDVRMFNSTDIIPSDTGRFDPHAMHSQRSNIFQSILHYREHYFSGSLQQPVCSLGIPSHLCSSIDAIQSLSLTDIEKLFNDPHKSLSVYQSIQETIKSYGSACASQVLNQGDDNWQREVRRTLQKEPEIFATKSQDEFFQHENFLWGEVDPFQQAFGRVFTTYRELVHRNSLLEKFPPPNENIRAFTDEEFKKEFGAPPWEFVNQILEECRLDFRMDNPLLHERSAYEPKFRKISKSVEMRFQDLSSGEKVLMSFALCLYNAQEARQAKVFPKLLLLDEIDAPLHPSMIVSLLNTIQNVLVRDKGVSVILTTHSPSTVALAPEEAVYAMNPDGPSIDKISKNEALNLLTTGVPTLSVSFDGRRQVFVESKTDARIYELLYQRYKPWLNSELSLNFIEVGNRDTSGGEHNSGCSQVKRIVGTLVEAGNTSVYGLVDWDGHQTETNRICVLSEGLRDGIESLLLDPLILVALIAKENIKHARDIGLLGESDSYVSLLSWGQRRWQTAVDTLMNKILTDISDQCLVVSYLNQIELKILKQFLHMDDHKLQELVVSKFGFLQLKNRHSGDLMICVAETILSDEPKLAPTDLIKTFTNLLK